MHAYSWTTTTCEFSLKSVNGFHICVADPMQKVGNLLIFENHGNVRKIPID